MGLPRRELWLTLLASSVWAFFNAGYLVFLSFAPQALQDSGFAAHQAIPMVSAASAESCAVNAFVEATPI
jgi:hypothetical protein